MPKSYVSLEQRVCRICGKPFDTNAILLDTRLRDRFDQKTVTGFGLCPDDKQKIDDGYVALVGIDEKKSERLPNGTVKPEGAWRTGDICYIRREAYERIFNVPLDARSPMAFCDPEVITRLAAMAETGGAQ